MINQRLTRAVEKLNVDDRLLIRFRRKPEKALAQFQLLPEEIETVKSGDLRALLQLGLDKKVAFPKPLSRPLLSSVLIRHGAKLAPATFLALALLLSPGTGFLPDHAASARRTRRVRVGRRINRRAAIHRRRARGIQLRRLERVVRSRRVGRGARRSLQRRIGSLRLQRRALRRIISNPDQN